MKGLTFPLNEVVELFKSKNIEFISSILARWLNSTNPPHAFKKIGEGDFWGCPVRMKFSPAKEKDPVWKPFSVNVSAILPDIPVPCAPTKPTC